MNGPAMPPPLLLSTLLVHAERHHGAQEIVSQRVEGDLHRCTYGELAERSRRLADALAQRGVAFGHRIATLAWNGYRHMEICFAAAGSGAVSHALDPRLHPDQLVWLADHAEDQVLFFDLSFLPLVEAIATRASTVKTFVAMTDRSRMPVGARVPNLLCYEELIQAHSPSFVWPAFDETAPSSLCYRSGASGYPQDAFRSHRSALLHTYAAALPDALGCSSRDVILPVVPMSECDAWGLPLVACMVGAKLVFPGPWLDGGSLYDLLEGEGVTMAAGLPATWQGLLAHLEGNGLEFSTMARALMGGHDCTPAMVRAFQARCQVQLLQPWGMAGTDPASTLRSFGAGPAALDAEARLDMPARQGRAGFGIDVEIVAEDGTECPHDGIGIGEPMVRWPWVISNWRLPADEDSTVDAAGWMPMTDGRNELAGSGGEWIDAVDLEAIARAHPGVSLAACTAARHPKRGERPLLSVTCKPGASVTRQQLIALCERRIAEAWRPDDVLFLERASSPGLAGGAG